MREPAPRPKPEADPPPAPAPAPAVDLGLVDPAAYLDQLPPYVRDMKLTLVAELGRKTLSVGEVLQIQPGKVVTLDSRYADLISINAGNVQVALGHVVMLEGGRLGVVIDARRFGYAESVG